MSKERDLIEKTDSKMGRPKGSPNIRPRIEKAFWNSLVELSRRRQKTLSEVLADELENDFNKTFSVLTKVLPKETHHSGEVNSGVTIQLIQFDKDGNEKLDHNQERKPKKIKQSPSDNIKTMMDKLKEKTTQQMSNLSANTEDAQYEEIKD